MENHDRNNKKSNSSMMIWAMCEGLTAIVSGIGLWTVYLAVSRLYHSSVIKSHYLKKLLYYNYKVERNWFGKFVIFSNNNSS
jgi:hypothetical protein